MGKDRLQTFLSRHAGAPDILDRLLEYFSTGLQVNDTASPFSSPTGGGFSPNASMRKSRSPGMGGGSSKENYSARGTSIELSERATVVGSGRATNGLPHSPAKPTQYRSRIDEYFRVAIRGRDL